MKTYYVIISLWGYCALGIAKTPTRPWQFSQELTHQDFHHLEPDVPLYQNQYLYPPAPQHPDTLDHLNHNAIIDRENLQSGLNFATLCYIVFNVYKTYQEVYMTTGVLPSDKDSLLLKAIKGIIIHLCPESLLNLGQHSKFLISTLAITLTALIYKSIIKLVIITTYSDVFEMISNRFFGEKKRFSKNYCGFSNSFKRSKDLSFANSDY